MYDGHGEVEKDEIDSDVRKLSVVLLKLFEDASEEGIASRNDLDVIKLMKEFLKKEVKAKEEKIKGIGDELVKIQQLAKRISCREGNRNLFGSIIDNKRKLLEHSRVGLGQDLRIIKLVLEELEAYDCLVEVVRRVDLYFVGGITASTA